MTDEASALMLSPGKGRLLRVFLLVGYVTLIFGLAVAPERIWMNVLLWGNYLVGVCLAGLVFVAISHVTSSGWSISIRRIPEVMSQPLPYAALIVLAVLVGGTSIFSWQTDQGAHPDSFWFKHMWLSKPFFLIRAVIYILIWIGFSMAMVRLSRAQDLDGDAAHSKTNRGLSAGFLVAFAFTFSLACFDWLMSLEP